MAKRFTATEIWNEDWFLEMPNEYKLFWYYMLSVCNHAGFYKVNLRSFCSLNGVKLTPNKVIEYFNSGKQRIRVINSSLWLIDDFFVYQYGSVLNLNNRVHVSIEKEYLKYGIELTSIRGLKEVKDGVKDKDKDKDKDKGIGKEKEKTNNLWFLRFFHSDYKYYESIFNGQSTTEKMFFEWKSFVQFIYDKGFTELFECKFLAPHDYAKLVSEKGFTKEKWEIVSKAILSTGVKPEHNLFFRIPQFMKYEEKAIGSVIPEKVKKTEEELVNEMNQWLNED